MPRLILPATITGKDGTESLGERIDEVTATEALVQLKDGREVYLFTIPGMEKGVSVEKSDLDAGLITKQQAYDELAQMWLNVQG